MKYISIWEPYGKKDNKTTHQNQNITTDILIIGGGITGITTAYFLKDKHKQITLIDKSILSKGVTANTTAKITYLEQDIYRKLTKMHNPDIAKKYYEAKKEAIWLMLKIIKNHNIACDLEKVSSILFTNEDKNIKKIEQEKLILASYGEKVKDYHDKYVKYGFSVSNTYTFNPLKYLNALVKIITPFVNIYENTMATNIKKEADTYIVTTNNGYIKAQTIILACHYPFFIIPFFFPIKTYIEREYVCAAKVTQPKKITKINIDNHLYSLRYYQNYLIYGTNAHKLTSNINYAPNYDKTIEEFRTKFKLKPEYIWMNQDIISHDKLPFIGCIKDNLFISSAYNTWGMTGGTIGAKIIADLIDHKDNAYIKLFNPKRLNIPLIVNSFIGLFHYLKAYIQAIFQKNNPKYIKIKGITYGIYKDKNGIEHKIKLLCPHMKCPLVFNQKEHTWDCPCHGSRFNLDGQIIETPAKKSIE